MSTMNQHTKSLKKYSSVTQICNSTTFYQPDLLSILSLHYALSAFIKLLETLHLLINSGKHICLLLVSATVLHKNRRDYIVLLQCARRELQRVWVI